MALSDEAKLIIATTMLIPLLILIFGSFYIIDAGEMGVLLTFGNPSDVASTSGLHFKIPLVQKVVKMDIKTQKLETETLAYSKDIQTVTTKLALNYHLREDRVVLLYKSVGLDFQSRVIDPAIQESVKSATAEFTAQELIEQRPKVKEAIKSRLNERLTTYFVTDEFSIIDFSFSDEYEKAVEDKQVAQQKALKAENDLVRIETEAQQRITQAQGEAEAIRIQAQAIQVQGGKEYVSMRAVDKWNGVMPIVVGSGSMPFISIPLTNSTN